MRRAVVVRWIAVERWFERQRRGRRRLIFVNCSWVRLALVVVAEGFDGSVEEEEEEKSEMEGWKRREKMGFEGKERG